MLGALLMLLVAAAEVKDVIGGSDDVWPCWKSLDVAFAEGFITVLSDEVAAKKKIRWALVIIQVNVSFLQLRLEA